MTLKTEILIHNIYVYIHIYIKRLGHQTARIDK